MPGTMAEAEDILKYALKLLTARDCSEASIRQKLSRKYGEVPEGVIETLRSKRFLNDRRYTENYIRTRMHRGPVQLRGKLVENGVAESLIDEMLAGAEWPSLHESLNAKMVDWNLRAPLNPRDAARLFRALARL